MELKRERETLLTLFLVVCVCLCARARTLELVPGVEDTHVCRYGVESAAPDDVHTSVSCLAAVVQLHAFQKLYTPSRKRAHGRKYINIRPGQIEMQKECFLSAATFGSAFRKP